MGDVVWLKALLKAIVLPPTGPLLLAAAGLLVIGRAPRGGRIVAWTGILLLIALSTPMVAFALLTLVDTSPPLDLQRARNAHDSPEPPDSVIPVTSWSLACRRIARRN